tara:strand:- start:5388 stop:5741 length:354 start_codon:yes stop_codon:yes gene_type:complete
MDILDDFSSKPTLTYHCIKEDCNNSYVSDGYIFMVCKLHGKDRPVMRYDGKKESDLQDELDNQERLSEEHSKEIMGIIADCFTKRVTGDAYYKKLADFWERIGFPDFAEETLLHVKD